MSIEKYSCYEFRIKKEVVRDKEIHLGYVYEIFDPDYKPSDNTVIRESDCWFDAEQEARFAAIGHIDLLENGEG